VSQRRVKGNKFCGNLISRIRRWEWFCGSKFSRKHSNDSKISRILKLLQDFKTKEAGIVVDIW